MTEQERAAGKHPGEVDALEDLPGEGFDFAVICKIGLCCEYSGEEEGRIDA